MASATVKVLRAGVDGVATTCRQEAAATAWHAEPIRRFFCSTFSDDLAGVGVSEDNFIVITAKFRAENRIGTMIAAGPEGTCACKISACDTHLASTVVGAARQPGCDRRPATGRRAEPMSGCPSKLQAGPLLMHGKENEKHE